MSSIFSTQNLQTFLRRKNLRPPSRPPPPGPRSPRGPSGLPPSRPPGLRGTGVELSWFTSSAIILLENLRFSRPAKAGLCLNSALPRHLPSLSRFAGSLRDRAGLFSFAPSGLVPCLEPKSRALIFAAYQVLANCYLPIAICLLYTAAGLS